MVSPELLQRFSFFAPFNQTELRAIAMLAEEIQVEAGRLIIEECCPADGLYLLLEGCVDLSYKSEEANYPTPRKEFLVGEIHPGEVFGISALIDPYVFNASALATQPTRLAWIEAASLRKLFEGDPLLGYVVMQQVVMVLLERLSYARLQAAAAWA